MDIEDESVAALHELFLTADGVSTDSRNIVPRSIFFALKGASFDGNKFAVEALAKGASYAVVDDEAVWRTSDDKQGRLILVDDVLEALQLLALYHRRYLSLPIIGIVGSNGKTTTKELVSAVLAEKYELCATKGNLNNHIGVPLTLLSMDEHTQMGVVEMGANHCGEIAALCRICEPNFGIITNVGRAHLEGFGGAEGVKRGKGELYDYLAQNGGVAFVRHDDKVLVEMAAERENMVVESYSTDLSIDVRHNLEGEYNAFNVAAAVAIGHYFGVDAERISNAVENYQPTNSRSQRFVSARNTLVLDCYNANPSSMNAALDNFFAEPRGVHNAKVVVLGDMLELGQWSAQEHRAVVERLAQSDVDMVCLVGGEFVAAARSAGLSSDERFRLYAHRDEVLRDEAIVNLDNCLILVKGSRGIALEKVAQML